MKTLVAYYSYSGNTEKVAKKIASTLNADTLKIETVNAYPDDYDEVVKAGRRRSECRFQTRNQADGRQSCRLRRRSARIAGVVVHLRARDEYFYFGMRFPRQTRLSVRDERRMDRTHFQRFYQGMSRRDGVCQPRIKRTVV